MRGPLTSSLGFWSEALPTGVYRIKFEDEVGYYLPAPGKIGEKTGGLVVLYDGGLYVPKNKPTVRKDKPTRFQLYIIPPERSGTTPTEDMVRAEPVLPWDFVKQCGHD